MAEPNFELKALYAEVRQTHSFQAVRSPRFHLIIEVVDCTSPDFPYQPEYPRCPTMQLMIHTTTEMLDKLEEKRGKSNP